MRLPKKFEFYVKKGIIRACMKNKERAEFLINESRTSFEGLKERVNIIGVNKNNANSVIKDCYDIIMELIRAKLLLEGFYAFGNYAHEAEISYLYGLGFKTTDISFINELRYIRNSVTYYGKILNEDYAEKVVNFLKKIFPQLIRKVKQ